MEIERSWTSSTRSVTFDPAAPILPTLQSAIPASHKLIADLKSDYADGQAKLMAFLKNASFFKVKSLLKNKRLAFEEK